MTQTAAKRKYDGLSVEHTPTSNVAAGDIVEIVSGVPLPAPHSIVANTKGVLDCGGIWDVPKTTDVFTIGNRVFWNASATDVGNNTGAAENSGGSLMGMCVQNAANTATHVRTWVKTDPNLALAARRPVATVAAAGGNIATAAALSEGVNYVTGADNAKGVQLPSCADGKEAVVINFTTDKTLLVYPPLGKQVNLAGANNSIAQAANTRVAYTSEGANCFFGS